MSKEEYLTSKKKKLDEQIDKLIGEWAENPSLKLFKKIGALIKERQYLDFIDPSLGEKYDL